MVKCNGDDVSVVIVLPWLCSTYITVLWFPRSGSTASVVKLIGDYWPPMLNDTAVFVPYHCHVALSFDENVSFGDT